MATLHIVNRSHLQQNSIKDCLRMAGDSDSLLLIEEAVYSADKHFASLFNTDQTKVYALKVDLEARGITDRVNPAIQLIDDSEFVQLVVDYDKSQSWY